jgi:hypothetical protein
MISTPMYPEGRTTYFTKWAAGILKFYKRDTAVEFYAVDGNNADVLGTKQAKNLRTRLTVAQVNAGATTILAARAGYKYRMLDAKIIAVGGTTAAGTSIDIAATQGGSAALLVVAAAAAIGRSVVARDGASNVVVLADGASYIQNDVNTAITVAAVGTFTGATHFDVILTYALEV